MPYLIKLFLKVLFNELTSKYKEEYGQEKILKILNEFFYTNWIEKVCFSEINLHGLSKDYFLGENCKDNIILMSKVI